MIEIRVRIVRRNVKPHAGIKSAIAMATRGVAIQIATGHHRGATIGRRMREIGLGTGKRVEIGISITRGLRIRKRGARGKREEESLNREGKKKKSRFEEGSRAMNGASGVEIVSFYAFSLIFLGWSCVCNAHIFLLSVAGGRRFV